MLELSGREHEYGLQWDLNAAKRKGIAELFPDEVDIYVRARYILSDIESLSSVYEYTKGRDRPGETPVASPWAYAKFKVYPRVLILRCRRRIGARESCPAMG